MIDGEGVVGVEAKEEAAQKIEPVTKQNPQQKQRQTGRTDSNEPANSVVKTAAVWVATKTKLCPIYCNQCYCEKVFFAILQ